MSISLQDIERAGPWAVLVFVLISLGVTAIVAWSKDAIVTGKRFRDLQQKTRRQEAQLLRGEKTLAQISKQLANIAERIAVLDGVLSSRDGPKGFHD